jgi:ElaB/YqjD/DUF883 family membrane-anchored ribosome-binding protein
MDAKEIGREQDRVAHEVERVSAAAHRVAMRAPDVADRVSEVAHRLAMHAPDVADRVSEAAQHVAARAPGMAAEVSDEVDGFIRRNRWVPIVAAATLGFMTAVVVMVRYRS